MNAFARNLLLRLNRDLNADFQPQRFRYQAQWQAAQSRVRMALVSDCEQSVCIGSNSWRFAAGEPLVTEYSVKYSPEMARDLAEAAGWRWCRRWHDPADDLSLHWLEAAD